MLKCDVGKECLLMFGPSPNPLLPKKCVERTSNYKMNGVVSLACAKRRPEVDVDLLRRFLFPIKVLPRKRRSTISFPSIKKTPKTRAAMLSAFTRSVNKLAEFPETLGAPIGASVRLLLFLLTCRTGKSFFCRQTFVSLDSTRILCRRPFCSLGFSL